MVKGSVGVPWGTNRNLGEVQVIDGVGGDRGGDGILLQLLVRLANKDTSPNKPKTNKSKPQNFC